MIGVAKNSKEILCSLRMTYHAVDEHAERNPDYQGENQDGTYDVVCQKLPCEQFKELNVVIE